MKFCLDFIILFLQIHLVRILENYLIYSTKLYSTSSQYASTSEYVKYIYCTDISNISSKSTTKIQDYYLLL